MLSQQPGLIDSLRANRCHDEMKYAILVVDDEFSGRTTLKILLEKHFWPHIETLAFSKSFEEAKLKIQTNQYDIIFLDINLKGISAFDLLTFIPLVTKVVFVTAYSEFMLQALRSKAFDYLVKPIKEEDLKECLLRIRRVVASGDGSLSLHIKQRGLTRIFKHADIIYIEGDGPYSTIHMKEENCITARTLKALLPDLGNGFVRIHKTYLVNRAHIKGFNKDKLILLNDKSLPVSRTGLKKLAE